MKICKEIGCGRKYFGAGLCSMHYSRLRRHDNLDKPVKVPWNKGARSVRDLCGESGCSNHIHSRDPKLCKIHYQRFMRHGDTARRWPPTLGVKWTPEHSAKFSAVMLGRTISPEGKQQRSAALMGRVFSKETKTKMRLAKLGRSLPEQHARNILLNKKYLRREYKGHNFRSSYELRLAQAFDARGIRWEYEPTRFDLGDSSYIPDFYLPDLKVYWEAKGYFWPKSIEKVRRFRLLNPDKPLIVANDAVIKMMEK
jgi:G:T-mismatch repair DNA endonuclease (very short patch repair protein)